MSLSTGLLGLFSVLAVLLFVAVAVRPERAGPWLPLAWALQALALLADLGGLGREQWGGRFGFAPALSLTVWLVIGVALFESRPALWTRARQVLAALAAVVVLLAWAFPGQEHAVHSRWAPLHWILGLASYGLVATAVFHGWLLQRAERQLRQPERSGVSDGGWPLLRLERLTFQFLLAGVVLLTLALLLGWRLGTRWPALVLDHKTLFALLAWSVLVGLVAGRQWLGWRGLQAVRWLYAGSLLLLLSYAGSRFVLQVLLNRPT